MVDGFSSKLIEILSENSRMSINKISKLLRSSNQKVMRRIQKLWDEGVICGYLLNVDPQWDNRGFSAIIRLGIDLTKVHNILQKLKKFPEVFSCSHVTGEFDIQLFAFFCCRKNLTDVIDNKIAHIDGVRQVNTKVIVRSYQFGRMIEGTTTEGHPKVPKLDELDHSIIEALRFNTRIPAEALARELKVDGQTILNRIKRLEANRVIREYSIVVNDFALGYGYLASIYLEIEPKRFPSVLSRILKLQDIRFLNEFLGQDDLHISVRSYSLNDLRILTRGQLREIPGIRTIEVRHVLKHYKRVNSHDFVEM